MLLPHAARACRTRAMVQYLHEDCSVPLPENIAEFCCSADTLRYLHSKGCVIPFDTVSSLLSKSKHEMLPWCAELLKAEAQDVSTLRKYIFDLESPFSLLVVMYLIEEKHIKMQLSDAEKRKEMRHAIRAYLIENRVIRPRYRAK